jgi:hypothetical protein
MELASASGAERFELGLFFTIDDDAAGARRFPRAQLFELIVESRRHSLSARAFREAPRETPPTAGFGALFLASALTFCGFGAL